VPCGFGNAAYIAKLKNLDGDFDQYIHDNTDDEITHFTFLNAYLESHGAQPVNLEPFRTLAGSKATGSSGQPRLTNLMQVRLGSRGPVGCAQKPSTTALTRRGSDPNAL
jgi:hypothetical protein